MVSQPGNNREIWKPLKVPDDERNYQPGSARSINDPPDIEEQQATKTFFRTDHSTNIFTATSSTISATFHFSLPQQPGGCPGSLRLSIQRLSNKACKAWCYTMPCCTLNKIL